MQKFRFLEWQVYKDAQNLFTLSLKIVANLPKEVRFSFGGQLTRAGLSIILNIAEGSGKKTDRDLSRFLDIALGSAYEVLAILDTLNKNKLLDSDTLQKLTGDLSSITSQLGGLKKSLRGKGGL